MASAPAKVLVLDNAPTNDSSVILINNDGNRRLWQIYFGGKKFGLEIEEGFDAPGLHASN